MKVLIAIDGSPHSFAAIHFVARLLSADADQVGFYYSAPPVKVGTAKLDEKVLSRARGALASAVFAEARQHLPLPLQEKVHEILGTQHPAHGIMVAAENWDPDLIVVGARGLSGLQESLLGSVSKSVVHQAACPVLVVRSDQTKDEPAPDHLRVLLACDGSVASKQAGTLLGELHWPAEATGKVVTVYEPELTGKLPDWLREAAERDDSEAFAQLLIHEQQEAESRKVEELTALCDELPGIFHGQPPLLREGYPAAEILKAIQEESADLIVIGSRGLKLWQRLLMGSTSEKVLSHAPCSVLVVHEAEQP